MAKLFTLSLFVIVLTGAMEVPTQYDRETYQQPEDQPGLRIEIDDEFEGPTAYDMYEQNWHDGKGNWIHLDSTTQWTDSKKHREQYSESEHSRMRKTESWDKDCKLDNRSDVSTTDSAGETDASSDTSENDSKIDWLLGVGELDVEHRIESLDLSQGPTKVTTPPREPRARICHEDLVGHYELDRQLREERQQRASMRLWQRCWRRSRVPRHKTHAMEPQRKPECFVEPEYFDMSD